MSDDSGDGADSRPGGRRFSRRRLLALSATGLLGSVAGCPGSGGGGTPTADPTPTPSQTPDSTPTERSTDPTATPEPTASPTATPTASPEPTPTPNPTASPTATASPSPTPSGGGTFDTSYLDESPSSSFAPTDGFGSADWLAERSDDLSIVRVTSLERSGEGSLPWALRQPGPRIVVFEVGGVVDLQGRHITTGSGYLYVAGQTAPSPGITVIRGAVEVTGNNTIVQHLRVRPGDRLVEGPREGDPAPAGGAVDALSVDDEVANVVLDHNSASWGTDEIMSIGATPRTNHITHTNNLIAEGLSHSPLHEEQEHSKATLVRPGAKTVSLIGNTYVNNVDRHPRMNGGAEVAVVNGFVYNFGEGIEMGGTEKKSVAAITGNYFKAGPTTPQNDPVFKPEKQGARAYIAFNETEPPTIPLLKNPPNLEQLQRRPLWPEGLQTLRSSEVPEHNLATAGARPADRTPTDERLVRVARNDEGEIIDSQSEVGGYPELAATERSLDPPAPGEGLAEWLHQHTRAVELPDASPP